MLVVRHNVEGEVRTNQLVCGEIPKSLSSIPLQQAGRVAVTLLEETSNRDNSSTGKLHFPSSLEPVKKGGIK